MPTVGNLDDRCEVIENKAECSVKVVMKGTDDQCEYPYSMVL